MKPDARLLWFIPVVLVGAVGIIAFAGCGSRVSSVKNEEGEKKDVNPWPKVDSQIRKDGGLASCRVALSQLNSDLTLNEGSQFQPAVLDAQGEAQLRGEMNLTDAELKELRPSAYSNLDPHYLAECLYLRDAVQSLDLSGLPPERQAELAFAWVCRQIVLNAWINYLSAKEVEARPPIPPAYVLRRGSGSGLERAFVYLALLQQLGFDGCLVGPPDAERRGWTHSTDPTKPPKGPFWAVGVRVDAEVILFDPWRGEPLPGANGTIATLAQVKSNVDMLKTWFEDKARPWDVTPDLVKSAMPFVAPPLGGLAPRMQRLEKELQSSGSPKLFLDPLAIKERFAKTAKQADVRCWNPTREPMTDNELFTATRLLNSFLPPAEGGNAPDERLLGLYQQSAIPADIQRMYQINPAQPEQLRYVVPPRLAESLQEFLPKGGPDVGEPEVIKRLANIAMSQFGQAFLLAPQPRERIHRGQFAEVTPPLIENRNRFQNGMNRLRTDKNRSEIIDRWSKEARKVHDDVLQARLNPNNVPGGVAGAMQQVDLFWRTHVEGISALVDLIVAQEGLAEATFLLALCMHEQAERSLTRYERLAAEPRTKDAAERHRKDRLSLSWAEAKGWWEKYEQSSADQERAFPGRGAHSRRLAERARQQAAAFPPPR